MSNKKKIVFFDFDGVIVNSLKHAHDTGRKFEPNLTKQSFIERFNGNIMHHPAIKKWGAKFQEHYSPGVPDQPIFPGIDKTIAALAQEYVLVIVSASLTAAIQSFLEQHNLTKYFTSALGSDVHASKHVKMENALQEHALPASAAVMITDTLGDLREADAAGVRAIAVTWGFHDEETLKQGQPYAIVNQPSELIGQVENILN